MKTIAKLFGRLDSAFLLFVGLSLAINWLYLFGGFFGDDIIFLNIYEQDTLPFSRFRGAWSLFNIPAFDNIWWRDADAGGAFFRPLPSLVIEGSVRLFGHVAFPLHLLALLLHGTSAFLLFLSLHRLGLRRAVAIVAALIFLACEDHSMQLGWIATITDIICVCLITLAMHLHVEWLARRRFHLMAGAIVAAALAFGCRETAVIAPVTLALMSFFFPRGTIEEDFSFGMRALLARVVSYLRAPMTWAPFLALLVIYLGLYRGLQLGHMNNLMYVNPLAAPGDYLKALVLNLPTLWLGTLSVMMISITMFEPSALPLTALAGTLLFALFVPALRQLRTNNLALWAFALYCIALLPQAAADAAERGLYFPHVFASVLFALLLFEIPALQAVAGKLLADREGAPSPGDSAAVKPSAGDSAAVAPSAGDHAAGKPAGDSAAVAPSTGDLRKSVPLATRLYARYLLWGVVLPGFFLSLAYPFMYMPSFDAQSREVLTAENLVRTTNASDVIMLNASSPFVTFYAGDILQYRLKRHVNVHILSACSARVTLEKTGDSSFIIRADRKGWISHMFARILRTRKFLKQGDVYRLRLFTVTLLELTPDREDVLAARFDMNQPLDAAPALFLFWDRKTFRPVDWGSLKPGERRLLADTSNVWDNF